MSDIVIKAENLGKKYVIGHRGENGRYVALRDVLMQNARTLWNKTKDLARGKPITQGDAEEVWALKDVSFEIKRGEAMGIIGRNGAGKSTLLKVLSRITEPSAGRVTIKGRVTSLLEVGTGFHPEMTGRENVYLNGTILGMTRSEIKRKFDEIVSFAEVEKYLDTPVKRYSSGMYLRLAFAVAAHLESEILILDEVLAVGDAEFQKKCLGKMENVSKRQGRTVLFVSHNMGAIAQLCNSATVMKDGHIAFTGTTDQAVSLYLEKYRTHNSIFQRDKTNLKNENQFVDIFNADSLNQIQTEYNHDDEIRIVFEVFLPEWNDMLEVFLAACDKHGRRIFTINIPLKKYYSGDPFIKLAVIIPALVLTPGRYSWFIFIHYPFITFYDLLEGVCEFSIIETGSAFSRYSGYDYGCIYPPGHSIERLESY
jgi:lipopolysaccharide transport system ATP-binding protein